ncbi:MAG: DUF4263 domain-containing protein [Proteobacteria bacterium]|nr:DUF4263 domain-containing protein [Pseudomonadota bacterium]
MANKFKVWESARNAVSRSKVANGYVYYRLDKENKKAGQTEIYRQVGNTFIIPFEGDKIRQLELEGFDDFDSIPWAVISILGFGFSNKAINNFFRFKILQPIEKIVISAKKASGQTNKIIQINITDIENLISELNIQDRANRDTKSALVVNFASKSFPNLKLKHKQTNNNKTLILGNLNKKLLEKLNVDDIEKIGEFYVKAIQKYKSAHLVQKLLGGFQKNAQFLTLQSVIKQYEKLLEKDPPEPEWQKFFEENITLFDNRYVKNLGKINIGLASTKYPDLTLVDIYGYVDFYELKRSRTTKLLKYDANRKTYYWSPEAAKAIAQVSNYLQKAKENGMLLSNAINSATIFNDNKKLNVSIISPRAIIVAGSSTELDDDNKRHQFKALRESMKDIEFLLYDEILDRLRNLLNNISV